MNIILVFDQQLYRIESRHEILTRKDVKVRDDGVEQVNFMSSELKEIALKNKRQSYITMIMLTSFLVALTYIIQFKSQPSVNEQPDFSLSDCE